MPLSASLMSGMSGSSSSSDTKTPIDNKDEKPIITPKVGIHHLESTLSGNLFRRPPLPPNQFQTKPLSKIAVIRPNSSTRILSRSPSPSLTSCRSFTGSSRSFYGSNSSLTNSPRSYSSLRSGGTNFVKSPTPRRIFPQASSSEFDLVEMRSKEQAPVIFDASLNFVLGIDRQQVRQSFKPTASHLEAETASNLLTSRISQFLQRTDHIMDEWKRIGHRNESNEMIDYKNKDLLKSRSATNIMIKGFQYFSRSNNTGRSRSRSASRFSEDTLSMCNDEVRHLTLKARNLIKEVVNRN